jgi:acyl dehydratase
MPCDARLVGTTFGPYEYDVDQFWTMAYAAGVGDANPRYIDSLRTGRLLAHPVFPVCLALPAMAEMDRLFFAAGLTGEESIRRVHATHDMTIARVVRPPEKVFVTTTLVSMEQRRPGAYVLTRYDVADDSNSPVATIHWGRIFRDVEVIGSFGAPPEVTFTPAASRAGAGPRESFVIAIPATAAIVYTACARPGNHLNFHTDTAAAQQSGLPAPILMGVATLAMCVSKIVDSRAGGDPGCIARVYGRFGAMVLMPSQLTVQLFDSENATSAIPFEAITCEGGRVVRDGGVILRH